MKFYAEQGNVATGIIINELGLSCEYEQVFVPSFTTTSGKDYLQINPKGTIPALITDDNITLTETSLILQYLAEKNHAEPLLPPIGDPKRYEVLEWLSFIATELHKILNLVIIRPQVDDSLKGSLYIPLLKKRLESVNQALKKNKFLVGDSFTLPDAYLFQILLFCDFLVIDLAEFPNLTQYYASLKKRKSVATTVHSSLTASMSKYQPEDVANDACWANSKKMDELFVRMRKECPVCLVEPKRFRPFWILTKFADMVEVDSKPDIFIHSPAILLLPVPIENAFIAKYGVPYPPRIMTSMDTAEHVAYAAFLRDWLGRDRILKEKEKIIKIANKYINEMISRGGECDFVNTVSNPYILRVLLGMLGIPESDDEHFGKIISRFHAPTDPDVFLANDGTIFVGDSLDKMYIYFKGLIEDRMLNPRDDLISKVANMKINGEPASELDKISLIEIILVAGQETSSVVLSGLFLVLAEHPELLKQLKENPSLIPSAIEEMIRWTSPLKTFMRTATVDYELRGQKIKAGDRLLLCFQSACKDEEYVDDPFTIRFDRKVNRHLAFGSGPYQCAGQHLARLNLITMVELLIPRLTSLKVNGPYRYYHSLFTSGLIKLPVQFTIE
jgi:cytochrome P450/glutathione S-transferase